MNNKRKGPVRTVGSMEVGESGWVAHWAFWCDARGIIWVMKRYPVRKHRGDGDKAYITRTTRFVKVDRSTLVLDTTPKFPEPITESLMVFYE